MTEFQQRPQGTAARMQQVRDVNPGKPDSGLWALTPHAPRLRTRHSATVIHTHLVGLVYFRPIQNRDSLKE